MINKALLKKIKNKVKEQRAWFLGMLLDTLREILFRNLFPGKGVIKSFYRTVREGQDF